MGAFNDKMTGLADAFRNKFSLTGALSIDDMTVTVKNAVIGEGGGEGGVDPSVIETTAADVLDSAWFMDNTGTLQKGSIQTVTAQLNGNVFTVAKGYIADPVEMTVTEAGDITVTDNVVNIPTGYISTPRTATVPVAQEPSVSGNVVTLYKGYQAEQKTITVEGGTDIPDGYADVSGVTATPNDVLMTARFVDSNGELQEGTIQPVTAYLTDNVFEVEEGFISNTTLTVPEAAAPTINGNEITLHKGYNPKEQTIAVEGNSTAVYGYLDESGKFQALDLTGDTPQDTGSPESIDGNVYLFVTGQNEPDYDAGVSTPANITVNGNIVTISKGAIDEQKKIAVGTALAAKTYTPGSSPIIIKAGQYLAGDQTIEAVQTGGGIEFYECVFYDKGGVIPAYNNLVISGITSPNNANGNYIQVSPTATSTERIWQYGDCACGFDKTEKRWIISAGEPKYANALFYSPSGILTSEDGTKDNPYLWSSIVSADSNKQTQVFNTADSQSGASDNYRIYIYVKLLAGVQYSIGMTAEDGQDNKIFLYSDDGTAQNENDDGETTIDGVSCSDAIIVTPNFDGIFIIGAGAYSNATGNTRVVCSPAPEPISTMAANPWEVNEWSAGTGSGAPVVSSIAVPERPETGIETWDGYKAIQNTDTGAWNISAELKTGLLVKGNKPKAGEIYSSDTTIQVRKLFDGSVIPIPSDGLVFYAPLQSDYVDTISGNDAIHKYGTITVYNGIDCVYIDSVNPDAYTVDNYLEWGYRDMGIQGDDAASLVMMVAPIAFNNQYTTFMACGGSSAPELFSYGALNNKFEYTEADIPISQWSVVIITRTGGDSRVYTRYLNGQNVGSESDSAYDLPSLCRVVLGNLPGYSRYFYGYMAHAAVYNRELTAEEVTEIHNALMADVQQ